MSNLMDRLKAVEGQELKYRQLCEAAKIPIKSGYSKTKQIVDLQMYCDIERLDKPTRYHIKQVYDEEITALGLINNNDRYQLMFEAAMYNALIQNGGRLYLSDMDCLKLFNEVNDNFPYACNLQHMTAMGDDYVYMNEMGLTTYKILKQWTRRRLEKMNQRKVVLIRDGFRLYTHYQQADGGISTVTTNVPENSAMEEACLEIYNRAKREIMPNDWDSDRADENCEEADGKQGKYWVPTKQWTQFERRIKELVHDKFGEEFDDLKCIKIISPPTIGYMNERIEQLYEDIQALDIINSESCRKIESTSTLNNSTENQRTKFIEANIKPNPPISFKYELKKKRAE